MNFWNVVQRRGAHVSTPKIGSRDGEIRFGGILRNHAVLRRESFRRNLKMDFFGVVGGTPRERWGGGGTLSVQFGFGGILLESFPEVTHSLKHIMGELVG
jgi:hypothetical protein